MYEILGGCQIRVNISGQQLHGLTLQAQKTRAKIFACWVMGYTKI
jgi:prophage antirepressor-like protein